MAIIGELHLLPRTLQTAAHIPKKSCCSNSISQGTSRVHMKLKKAAAVAVAATSSSKSPSVLKLERSYVLTQDQISKTKTRLDEFINSVATNPERRDGAYPYYLLHNAGEKVFGTVLLFHGFSSIPHQLSRLAQYLFDTGFNVYQPCISNHYLVNPDKNWPQVDLKPEWKGPIRQKWLADPVLSSALSGINTVTSNQEQLNFIIAKIDALDPDMKDIIAAINDGDYTQAFAKYYDSSHMKYVADAEARLSEVEALPGPAFTVGLSVGGTVALGLAAHHPEKISKVVAYAPLLKECNEVKRQFSLIAGPLDLKESGWDPNLQFTVGCFAATDVLGNHVKGESSTIASFPTFLMLTRNDDSADIPTNLQFTETLSATGGAGVPHLQAMYEADDRVPHPMVDPTEVSQGMSNKYWAALYQETFRFLTEGIVNKDNLKKTTQDPGLPLVDPV